MTQQATFGKRGLAPAGPSPAMARAKPRAATDSDNLNAHRDVDFNQSVVFGFKNFFDFTGRSSRGAYWWWVLFCIIVSLLAGIIDVLVLGDPQGANFSNAFAAATFIPSLALAVRRLHDVGRSGWWYLLIFTIIGVFVLLFWFCWPGKRATNKYGEDVEAGR